MKLISLKISSYKNLKNIQLDFSSKNGTTVLIGNNGCGKSNLIEAICIIFRSLYLITDSTKRANFDFVLIYQFNYNRVEHIIEWSYDYKTNKLLCTSDKTGVIKHENVPNILPSEIIGLYSGEEMRLWNEFFRSFYLNYNSDIIANKINIESSQKFLYINKYYWDIALLVLLCTDVNLSDILGSLSLSSIEIEFDIENLNRFLKRNPNETNAFIAKLSDGKPIMTYTRDSFWDYSDYEAPLRLFKFLSVSYLPKESDNKLIKRISLNFGDELNTSSLSEGEKKKLLLKLVLHVLADVDSIILLDEPDSHIHIAHKADIKKMIDEYNHQIILTTHSATMMNIFADHLVYLDHGEIIGKEKSEILNEISGGTMSTAQRQILLNTDSDILIVEGKTDEKYIIQALNKLKIKYPQYTSLEFNFLYMGGSDSEILGRLIERFPPKKNQTIIAFFDNDGAGYDCVKKLLDIKTEKKDFKGAQLNGIHVHLYPKKENFPRDDFEIEDYFPIEKCRDFMFNGSTTFKDIKSKFKKTQFSEECKNFDTGDFEGFKVIFDLIIKLKENQ